jgi:hypothetical protein
VAWKYTGADLYTVWNTDSSGNITTNTIGSVSGSSIALQTLETSFHQDLNGDGVIGIVGTTTTVIEALGSTKLDQVGSNFFFDPVSGGTGPELKYAGVAMTAGQWGSWTPIGVEATAGGYEVAWKYTGANLYTVWNTDSSGNITTDTIGSVSGSSTTLETLETSFHQDLNGDGVIGVPSPQSPSGAAQASNPRAPTVAVANNDSFVFGAGAAAGGNGGNADTSGHYGSPTAAADQFAALFADIQAARSQAPASDAHDAPVDPGHHDAAAIGLHVVDPHFGGFVIG